MGATLRFRWLDRADRAAAVFRTDAEVPPRCAGARPGATAGTASRAGRAVFRSAAAVVRAVRARTDQPHYFSAKRVTQAADFQLPPPGFPAPHTPKTAFRA